MVIDAQVYDYLTLFYENSNKEAFAEILSEKFQVDYQNAIEIFLQLREFLDSIGIDNPEALSHREYSNSTEIYKEHYYSSNKKVLKIAFGSSAIESLIHPQFAHLELPSGSELCCSFSITEEDDSLLLFRDKAFVNRYLKAEPHYLQGRMALEITNAFHGTTIDKWIATFHGSTISNGKEALMLVGDSGNGKSTLAALLMTAGFQLLSDDFSPLYEDLNLYQYPAAIAIKKGAFDTLETEISNLSSISTQKHSTKRIDVRYLPGENKNNALNRLSCSKIVYVKYNKNISSHFSKMHLAEVVETLIPDAWISPRESHAKAFLDWLEQVQCYKLEYSDNLFAITQVSGLLT